MIGSTLLGPRAITSWPPHDDRWYGPVAAPTRAGVDVDEEIAMSYATIFACVNKYSKTIATLPVHVIRDLPGDRRENVPAHPVRRMFTKRFNAEALAVPTRQAMLANLLLWGNAYFEIIRGMSGDIAAMVLLPSKYVTPERDKQTGELFYKYREPGQPEVKLRRWRVLHIVGLGYDGLVGKSVIGQHRETAAVGIATNEYRASFLGNGASPGVVLSRPPEAPVLSPEGETNLVNSFNRKHAGSGNAFRTAVLQEGTTATTIGMSMDDAQFVELARYDRETWCGVFDTPPSMIHDNTRSTYTNAEQQALQWVKGSLLPVCVLVESAVDATLLSDEPDLHLKHNLEGLLRGDFKSRMEGYSVGRTAGLYCTNDMRRQEELEPVEGGDDDFLRPMNMTTEEQRQQEAQQSEAGLQDSALVAEKCADAVGGHVQSLCETIDTAFGSIKEVVAKTHDDQTGRLQNTVESLLKLSCDVEQIRRRDESRWHSSALDLLIDPAERAIAKETKAIASALKRAEKDETTDRFLAWLNKFYGDHAAQMDAMFRRIASHVAREVSPSGIIPAGQGGRDILTEFCEEEAHAALTEICGMSDIHVALEAIEHAKAERPRAMAERLLKKLANTN